VEGLALTSGFWSGRRVLLTGHTGFKGAWLSLWLQQLGAEVAGFSLAPPSTPNLFELANVAPGMTSVHGDVRDLAALTRCIELHRPEVVIHMAAQALVRASFADPVETFSTNVMGTVTLLDAVRRTKGVRAVVNVTTDKCYQNNEWAWGYREVDRLGGFDPYSNSKACSELATDSFRNSFFPLDRHAEHGVAIATARAGNVIGGGDWAADRLIPDIMRAWSRREEVVIRNPHAVRPWQHVLEPLSGYLSLAEHLVVDGPAFAEAFNFGPADDDARPVASVVETMQRAWGAGASWTLDDRPQPHEASVLRLDCSRARQRLSWRPRWSLDAGLSATAAWYREFASGGSARDITLGQIADFSTQDAAA
jgi:CDP-glucose 4,6-dehydratase